MVQCSENADHPGQILDSGWKPLKQAQNWPVTRRSGGERASHHERATQLNESDPQGYTADRPHPDHIRGLSKRQTALRETVIGLIGEFRHREGHFTSHDLLRATNPSGNSGP